VVVDAGGAVSGFGKASGAAAGFGKTIAKLGVGVAIGKAITSTISAAKDFNQAMADLKAVSGATAIEMGKLSAQAIKAGAATKFSANEAAQGQIALSKAGLTATQIMGGGLQTALALAAAGDIEVGQAAEMAANAMKLFNLQGKDLSGVADAMATAANTTTADVGDFAIALSQGGAAAKQAGLSFKDTMVVLEALAEQGVKGSDAGTSLKTALLSLAAPVGDGAAAIKKYGLEFFKSNGEIKSAAGLAGELNSKLGGLNKQQRTAVLQAIAGRDGFRTLAAMMDTGAPKVARMRKELDKVGSAAKVAADRQDSLSGDVEQLTGSIETLQIKAMGKVVPMLRQAAQSTTGFINALGDGSGAVGAFAGDLGSIATGAAHVAGELFSVGSAVVSIGAGVAGPFIGLVAAVASSETGVRTLTVAVVSLAGAYVAVKVAAGAVFAITKAQAILQSAAAFIQLARTVTTAGEAMALMQAATLATPWGLVAAGVGLAAGAAIALSGAFRSGKSAADIQRDAMKTVADAARDVTSALDAAEQSVLDYQRAQLNAKQASLDITTAQKAYNESVKQYGRNSLEAAQANVQLEQAKLRGIETSRTAAQAADVEKRKILESAETILRKNTEQKAAIATMEQQLAGQRALNSGTAEGRVKIAEMSASLAAMKRQQSGSRDQFISLTTAASDLAAKLKGDTRPGVSAVRQQLLDLANAKPADLPKVIAAIKAGVTKGSAAAKAGADKTKTNLKNVDTPVSLNSWVASIQAAGNRAIGAAQGAAAGVRAALASANADVRNSPSANDRMRTSMVRMKNITASGMKQTNAVTKRGVDAIIASRQKLDDQLARIDRAAAARDGSRGRLQNRADAAGRVESTFSDVESRSSDLVGRIGQALDERVAVYDRRLSEITTRRNILQGGKAIRDADQALAAAQSRLEAVRSSIQGAASDSERETAQRYLDQAVNDVEDAKLAAEAARLQVERDKTSLTVDKKKQQVERRIGDLVERLRAGEISGKRFNREITRILGDPVVRGAIQASGTSLGLAFARGMARTEQQVKAGAIRLATIVAQYLKLRSPAEKGPLAFDFTRSGAAIGNDFAAGLAGRQAAMESQARSFALSAIPIVRVGTNTSAQPVTQAGGLVQHNTFNVQGPFDARQASHDLRWEAQYSPAGALS
jgi:TP901 family phage tail tape measure protein